MPRVSVIIPCYNYGQFLKQAIESVLSQGFQDYEIIIVDDASTDDTREVLKEYRSHPKIRFIKHAGNKGLAYSTDEAIKVSTGEYIVRLDADDYFDENALLVLANVLDSDPEIALVYPDYFLVSEEGGLVNYIRLPKVNEEVKLLDLPANGAGTMFRRRCYEAVGGYDLSQRWQDNYDLWLKFLNRFKVDNVNLPLFYYRRHGSSMTSHTDRVLQARRDIKKAFLTRNGKGDKPRVLGLIPARAHDYCDYLAIRKLGSKPLVAYTIEEALKADMLDKVVFTTEDKRIAEVAQGYGIQVILRPSELAKGYIEKTVFYVLKELEREGYKPDIVAVLHINSPFKTAEHIDEAINTLLIYNADGVISVCQDRKFHYVHDVHGLKPLFQKRLLRQEKEGLYEENGAIYVFRRDMATEEDLLRGRTGHILMTEEEGIRINSEYDFWLAEQILKKRQREVKGRKAKLEKKP